ncbi:hypothetical protein NC651_006896 [Populus alba x Populus x berolinensis]|uniref:Uncharacterized protein n=1 Tax=Populus davidiana TaxID=266767 RepID=A0A6M2ECZ9_9ROSI|nr:hypothetical protein NC651_006896 [Populus alba x Populus x berolinensis]
MDKCGRPSSKLWKSKANISINAGGLVVLGGALAVTSLIAAAAAAAFAVKRRRRDKDLLCKREVKDLSFILQNPSTTFHQNTCLTDGSTGMLAEETQIDSIEMVSIGSVILEENSAPVINGEIENFKGGDQKILITDDPKQEMIIASCDNCCAVEELALPVLDSKSMSEGEDKIKNDSEENSSWMERFEIKRQEEEVDTERVMEEETKSVSLIEEEKVEQKRVEGEEEEDEEGHRNEEYDTEEESVCAENLTAVTTVAMRLVEGEEEEEDSDSGEEYVMEERYENSEGTGSTCAETNAEAVWAAESIEVLSQTLKNATINMENSGKMVTEEDGSTTKTEEFGDSIEALPLAVKNTSVNFQSSESKEKIVEEDRGNKTQEFGDFNEAKSNILNDDTNNHETSKNPKSLKKKEMPELVEVDNQTTEPTRRKIWVCSILLLAFLLLIIFTHRSCLVLNGSSLHVNEV